MLSAYFVISATRTGTRCTGPGRPSYSPTTTSPLAWSYWPTTVFGGSWKSRTDEPSRRNSGLTARPKPSPATRPECSSRIGFSTSSQVPGIIVERNTTV